MPRWTVNFTLVLLMLMILISTEHVHATRRGRSKNHASAQSTTCNFDKNSKNYTPSDLLQCLNALASEEKSRSPNIDLSTEGRANREGRTFMSSDDQSSDYTPNLNEYFPDKFTRSLGSLWPNDFPIPRFADLLGLNVFENPGQKLFGAMSSISKHDDYRCVPRILCEISSGSTPGESSYRSARPTTGQILLFNLLSAFDRSGASPLALFGKAALLGYVNRGDPTVCYHEYPRCPRSQQELIAYLNNYKGGFFRFFTMNNYDLFYSETPQQGFGLWSSMRPEYLLQKPSNNNNKLPNVYEFSSGTAFYNPQQTYYQDPFAFNQAESETKWPSYMHGSRTGTGKFSFSNEDYFSQSNNGMKMSPLEFYSEQIRLNRNEEFKQ